MSAALLRAISSGVPSKGLRYGSGHSAWCTRVFCGTGYFQVLCEVSPSAAGEVPWYALRTAITSVFPVCRRAIVIARSLASLPLLTK